MRVEDGIAYGDVPDRVDFAYVADVTRINLALAPPAPASAGLSVDTRLAWQPPEGGQDRLAGYYVLARATMAPLWEQKIFAGDVTEYTLEGVSKDDHFFGLQSVDREGHESTIVFTRPLFR